jgi:hypothetical protein
MCYKNKIFEGCNSGKVRLKFQQSKMCYKNKIFENDFLNLKNSQQMVTTTPANKFCNFNSKYK